MDAGRRLPEEQNERSESPMPPPPSHPRRDLNAAERDLLEVVAALQIRSGTCWAGQKYLAEAIGVSQRYIRTLQKSLNEKGYLALSHRHGRTTLCKLRERSDAYDSLGGQPGAGVGRPRNKCSAPPRNKCSSPGRNKCSANSNSIFDSSADGAAKSLFDEGRTYWNPLRPKPHRRADGWVDYDNRPPQQRVSDAFNEKLILFVDWRGEGRLITSCKWGNNALFLELGVERSPGETEQLTIPAIEVGGLKFWR